jgi:drug/metabolite transporter superfamily protein YnfA
MKGFFIGALALIVLEVVVTSDSNKKGGTVAGDAVGGVFGVAANLVRAFVDPTIPAFKAKAGKAAANSTAQASTAQLVTPGPILPSQISGGAVTYA